MLRHIHCVFHYFSDYYDCDYYSCSRRRNSSSGLIAHAHTHTDRPADVKKHFSNRKEKK